MANTWATFGIDLHLDLTGSRVRTGLEQALRDAVETGRLHPGTRLPSSRTLAADLGIARNTVATAYGQLVAEGWLTARPGSGTQVADQSPQSPPRPRRSVAKRANCATTCGPGRRTCPRSPARGGSPPRAARSTTHRTKRSAIRTHAAGLSSALR